MIVIPLFVLPMFFFPWLGLLLIVLALKSLKISIQSLKTSFLLADFLNVNSYVQSGNVLKCYKNTSNFKTLLDCIKNMKIVPILLV